MSKCRYCGVEVVDDTEFCPLCRGVLDKTDGDAGFVRFNEYPDVGTTLHRFSLVKRILFFIAAVVSLLVVAINVQQENRHWWSIIVVYVMFYLYGTFCRFTNERYQVFTKIAMTIFWGLIYMVVIDAVFGFTRWSINYILPAAIILIDVVLFIVMLADNRNFQSYLAFEIIMMAVGLIPLILLATHVVTSTAVCEVAFLSSVILFLGTLIIGGRAARTEMQRRFHI